MNECSFLKISKKLFLFSYALVFFWTIVQIKNKYKKEKEYVFKNL